MISSGIHLTSGGGTFPSQAVDLPRVLVAWLWRRAHAVYILELPGDVPGSVLVYFKGIRGLNAVQRWMMVYFKTVCRSEWLGRIRRQILPHGLLASS